MEGLNLGQKDISRSSFEIWHELTFSGPRSKLLRAGLSDGERHKALFNTLMDFGEHDLVSAVAGGLPVKWSVW